MRVSPSFIPLFFILGACLVILLFFFSLQRVRDAEEAAFLQAILAEARVREHVSYRDKEYEVRFGTVYTGEKDYAGEATLPVLRLAYAKAAARRAPLLSLSGTDPQKLRNAIAELHETARALSAMQKTSRDAFLVHSALYPFSYLESLASLEEARAAFLESGTRADAEKYRLAFHAAAASYEKDLQDFRRAFEELLPSFSNAYATEQKIIRRNTVLRALETLDTSMQAVVQTHNDRESCMRGAFTHCAVEDVTLPRLPHVDMPALPENDATDFLVSAGVFSERGPTIALSESACIQKRRSLVFSFASSAPKEAYWPVYVGDVRFVRPDMEDTAFLAHFHARGIEYVPSTLFTHYGCPDIRDDVGRIYAVREIARAAHSIPISQFVDDASVRSLERRLASSYMRESDAVEYLSFLYGKGSELPEEVENHFVALALAFAERSTAFDTLPKRIAYIERSSATEALHGGIPAELDAAHLFFVRSAFPSLFAVQNSSYSLFEENTLSDEAQPYIFLSSLPKDVPFQSKLIQDTALFFTLRRYHE